MNLPSSPPPVSARRRAFGNSSLATSATRTRAAPMAARLRNSSRGASSTGCLKQLERPHLPRCVAANSLTFFII